MTEPNAMFNLFNRFRRVSAHGDDAPQAAENQSAGQLVTLDPAEGEKATRLHLGCGENILDGWLNADLVRVESTPPGAWKLLSRIYLMDARLEFPFRDNQFEYVFCEDFLEHFPQKFGLSIIAECFRTLKPGGVWRLSTPGFDHVLDDLDLSRRANIEFRHWEWGHELLYTEEYLFTLLKRCGFRSVGHCSFGNSSHPPLAGIDSREEQSESNIILEATKP